MKKGLVLIFVFGLFGCATTSDIENIQSQITNIQESVKMINAQSLDAKESSTKVMQATKYYIGEYDKLNNFLEEIK